MPDFVHSTFFLRICSITTVPRRPCLENEESSFSTSSIEPENSTRRGYLDKVKYQFSFSEKGRVLRGQ